MKLAVIARPSDVRKDLARQPRRPSRRSRKPERTAESVRADQQVAEFVSTFSPRWEW